MHWESLLPFLGWYYLLDWSWPFDCLVVYRLESHSKAAAVGTNHSGSDHPASWPSGTCQKVTKNQLRGLTLAGIEGSRR